MNLISPLCVATIQKYKSWEHRRSHNPYEFGSLNINAWWRTRPAPALLLVLFIAFFELEAIIQISGKVIGAEL